jgi:ribosome-associated protein
MECKLRSEFIELDNLLKALHLVPSGGEAKRQIQAGAIKVNGQVETRVRRKLRAGDCVEFGGQKIDIRGQ